MNEISYEIKEARLKHGLNQADLAGLLHISVQAVSKWESGISMPSAENLVQLIRYLDIDFNNTKKSNKWDRMHPYSSLGMESVANIYKIGMGPSSSHSIGPELACKNFLKKIEKAVSEKKIEEPDSYKAILYGSLAKTGQGHGTKHVIQQTFGVRRTIVGMDHVTKQDHPNTMEIFAYKNGKEIISTKAISIGGGDIIQDGVADKYKSVYKHTTFSEISAYCHEHDISLSEYVKKHESKEDYQHLYKVWKQMKMSIKDGLSDEGILPGELGVHKKAKQLFESAHIGETAETKQNRLICAYAFAVSEQNASAKTIVTSPTCGAAGVLPAVLYYQQQIGHYSDDDIVKALATAGLIGNIVKTNASISGAECGCQAEIGTACAMASAALGELFGLGIGQIEYAAEIALEHHLGLTCDPVCGLVQIPCIERNAVAAMRALNAVNLSSLLWNTRKISFDSIVKTMKETGEDMSPLYRETSEGGMAKLFV